MRQESTDKQLRNNESFQATCGSRPVLLLSFIGHEVPGTWDEPTDLKDQIQCRQ